MKRTIMLVLAIILCFSVYANDRIELVESIPIETTLDNDDIRNTPEVWLEMINSAKKTLDFGEFYISHKEGEALTPILDAIVDAADRGVKVRFVIDGNMYKTYPKTADKLNEYKNIDVRVYNLNEITGGVLHAKYFIVDDKEIFIGSQNMDWRALKHIHELGIRVQDKSLVEFYRELYDLDWTLAAENANTDELINGIEQSKNTYRVLHNFGKQNQNGFDKGDLIPTASNPKIIYYPKNWDEVQLVNMINDAQDRIKIQLLSYSPYSRGEYFTLLDVALRKAAARGVNVEMILSDWNFYSPRIDYIKSLHAIPNLEIKFSTIPEASEGYIGYARVEHCKYMVVDDKEFWLGTSNWSKSYFHNGRNVGLIVRNNTLAERMSAIFDKSWDSPYCTLVDLGKTYERKEIGE